MISERHHHCEPDLVDLPDGRLLAILRPRMSQTISKDKGRTWSKPTRLLVRGDAPGLLLTRDGVLLCGHRERPGTRTGLIMSTDFGKTWSLPRMIDGAGDAYAPPGDPANGRVGKLPDGLEVGGEHGGVEFVVEFADYGDQALRVNELVGVG